MPNENASFVITRLINDDPWPDGKTSRLAIKVFSHPAQLWRESQKIKHTFYPLQDHCGATNATFLCNVVEEPTQILLGRK
jgi:hypothetical protein